MSARTGCPARLWFRILEEERSISGLGLHLPDAKVGLFYSVRWIELRLGFFATFKRHMSSSKTLHFGLYVLASEVVELVGLLFGVRGFAVWELFATSPKSAVESFGSSPAAVRY